MDEIIAELEALKPKPKCRDDELMNSGIDEAIRVLSNHQPTPDAACLELHAAIYGIIGYCESLEVGTIINAEYMERMRSYYVPKLLAALQPAAKEKP